MEEKVEQKFWTKEKGIGLAVYLTSFFICLLVLYSVFNLSRFDLALWGLVKTSAFMSVTLILSTAFVIMTSSGDFAIVNFEKKPLYKKDVVLIALSGILAAAVVAFSIPLTYEAIQEQDKQKAIQAEQREWLLEEVKAGNIQVVISYDDLEQELGDDMKYLPDTQSYMEYSDYMGLLEDSNETEK